MKSSILTALLLAPLPPLHAADDIQWLLSFDGAAPPSAPWTPHGKPEARVEGGALHLADSSKDDFGFFRAGWKAEADTELVVEATVRVGETTGVVNKPGSRTLWPWKDGAPVSLLVSDGRHQEGLVFYTDRATTWTDRFVLTDTAGGFHTYRLVIRDTDMSVAVDGDVKVRGQNAFWKLADGTEPFIQFGSNCKNATGRAEWRSVRLGVRKASAPAPAAPVKITMSEPWPIVRPGLKYKPTRPYVYSLGGGRIIMSVAQGPDAIYEPYGVMLSEDEGRTWSVVKDWDQTEKAPLPMLRLKSGDVLGQSRWTWPQEDGSDLAFAVRWSADLATFKTFESRIHLPPEFRPQKIPFTVERHIFENADGSLLMAGYSKTGPSTPEGLRAGKRYSHLLRSTDAGATWNHFATVGAGGEPAIARLGEGRMTALLRTGPFKPFHQTFSDDDGKTWSAPVLIEEGSVCPDLVPMSNGLLACSYGRPASCLMFSADGGRTWSSHHVISEKTGFNYSGIVEVRPGRLLYVHDGGGLQAMHIDVERTHTGNAPATPITAPRGKPEPAASKSPDAPAKVVTDYALRTAKELKPTRVQIYKTARDSGRERKLEMHIFEPENFKATDKRPCFLALHGGGWVAGTADVMYCVAQHFAQRGWLGVSLQYRIARADRGTTVFDCVRDARSAVRYLRAHAAELGIDPNQIVVGGRSAGGHLAAATALLEFDEPGEDMSISCAPNALALYSAVLDTSENGYGKDTIGDRWAELSPLPHVRAGLPPTLVLHGLRDTTAPVVGAKAFAEAMVKAGNKCELILNDRGGHSYMMRTEPLFLEAMRQTSDFLAKCGIADPIRP